MARRPGRSRNRAWQPRTTVRTASHWAVGQLTFQAVPFHRSIRVWQIMQVNFREGQDVRAGDLLILIDPRPYQVALAQAEANLQKDEAQLKNAKAQYERNNVLYQQGVIAKQDLDTLQASFGTLKAPSPAIKP